MPQPIAIDEHAIRQRAHERWLEQGCPQGTSERDWLDAECELIAEAVRLAAAPCDAVSEPAVATASRAVIEAPVPNVRRRAPRSIVTRAGAVPAAQWLVALAPEATRELRAAAANGTKLGRR
jgi:hypothetical protein